MIRSELCGLSFDKEVTAVFIPKGMCRLIGLATDLRDMGS
jgi:hypothetical protein